MGSQKMKLYGHVNFIRYEEYSDLCPFMFIGLRGAHIGGNTVILCQEFDVHLSYHILPPMRRKMKGKSHLTRKGPK